MPISRRRQQLESEGWKRMSVTDEPRRSELAESYRDLGFEVHLEPVSPEELEGCVECIAQAPDRYRTIYVRKRSDGADDNELFS